MSLRAPWIGLFCLALSARAAVLVSDPGDLKEEPGGYLNLPSMLSTSSAARALAELGRPPDVDQQIRDAREALARNPQNPGSHARLGEALLLANRIDEAAECFWRAARLRPRDVRRLEQLGFALLAGGDHANGLRVYEEVARVDGESPSVRLNLAAALHRVGRSGEALAILETLAAEHPKSLRAWYNLGVVQWAQGDAAAALESLQRARDLQPNQPFVQAALARVQQARGRADLYEEARVALRERLGETVAETLLAQDPLPTFLSRGSNP
ncbi:MAG: tetratricopeptide repeat protein [Kiritimatiellae bacterium]|nr:tetratricopeptide repeat protein [Kiritimatiellia bacterium]